MPKPDSNADGSAISENGDLSAVENGVTPTSEEKEVEEERNSLPLQTEEKPADE